MLPHGKKAPVAKIDDASTRPLDVLFGRGRTFANHTGNLAYRALIKQRYSSYWSKNWSEKDAMADGIIQTIEARGGRFLCPLKDNGGWSRCPHKSARAKVKQALRDSSRKAKLQSVAVSRSEISQANLELNMISKHGARVEEQDFRSRSPGLRRTAYGSLVDNPVLNMRSGLRTPSSLYHFLPSRNILPEAWLPQIRPMRHQPPVSSSALEKQLLYRPSIDNETSGNEQVNQACLGLQNPSEIASEQGGNTLSRAPLQLPRRSSLLSLARSIESYNNSSYLEQEQQRLQALVLSPPVRQEQLEELHTERDGENSTSSVDSEFQSKSTVSSLEPLDAFDALFDELDEFS